MIRATKSPKWPTNTLIRLKKCFVEPGLTFTCFLPSSFSSPSPMSTFHSLSPLQSLSLHTACTNRLRHRPLPTPPPRPLPDWVSDKISQLSTLFYQQWGPKGIIIWIKASPVEPPPHSSPPLNSCTQLSPQLVIRHLVTQKFMKREKNSLWISELDDEGICTFLRLSWLDGGGNDTSFLFFLFFSSFGNERGCPCPPRREQDCIRRDKWLVPLQEEEEGGGGSGVITIVVITTMKQTPKWREIYESENSGDRVVSELRG